MTITKIWWNDFIPQTSTHCKLVRNEMMHQLISFHKPNKKSETWEDGLTYSSNQTLCKETHTSPQIMHQRRKVLLLQTSYIATAVRITMILALAFSAAVQSAHGRSRPTVGCCSVRDWGMPVIVRQPKKYWDVAENENTASPRSTDTEIQHILYFESSLQVNNFTHGHHISTMILTFSDSYHLQENIQIQHSLEAPRHRNSAYPLFQKLSPGRYLLLILSSH
jgi:hypothetical protein